SSYLGQADNVLPDGAPVGVAAEAAGPTQSPRNQRRHLLDVSAAVAGGRLLWSCTYNTRAHDRQDIERLAEGYVEALRELLAHCRSGGAGCAMPPAFTAGGVAPAARERCVLQSGEGVG